MDLGLREEYPQPNQESTHIGGKNLQIKPYQNQSNMGGSLIAGLGISYVLCRFVFFDLHGMKSWPTTLASVGLVVIFIAVLANLRILGIAAVAGYLIGFILAMLFNTESLDPGGGIPHKHAFRIHAGCNFHA